MPNTYTKGMVTFDSVASAQRFALACRFALKSDPYKTPEAFLAAIEASGEHGALFSKTRYRIARPILAKF